ncbi:hypothetical protein [Streptomyces noursei]|uniref:hypothetical protein n=1 Tax=Streptomyces noursei TaxID=1971 RepID=UPI000B10BD72|nr:hypothetical protein [Streptomyces noursei]
MSTRYLPVTLNGETIGYLSLTDDDNEVYFLRRMASRADTLLAAARWSMRMDQDRTEGLAPIQAMQKWIGIAEDPEAGGIPEGSELLVAEDEHALMEIANPDDSSPVSSGKPDGKLSREQYPETLASLTLEQTGYPFLTDSPVRYLPVTLRGKVLGYLWASEEDDAADYEPRAAAAPAGLDAGLVWGPRLMQAWEEGLTPLQALRQYKGEPEHSEAGGIAADADERVAPTTESLEELARQEDEGA